MASQSGSCQRREQRGHLESLRPIKNSSRGGTHGIKDVKPRLMRVEITRVTLRQFDRTIHASDQEPNACPSKCPIERLPTGCVPNVLVSCIATESKPKVESREECKRDHLQGDPSEEDITSGLLRGSVLSR